MGIDQSGKPGTTARPHEFTLYVAGIKPASRRAVVNMRAFCEKYLRGRFHLRIIDVAEHPEAARAENVVAIPTLVRTWPLPRQIFVGDLSKTAILQSRLAPGES